MTPSLARFAGLAAATLAAVCGVGLWPTLKAAGTAGLASMALAAGVALVSAVVGYLPSVFTSKRYVDRLQAAMTGVLARMLLTAATVLAIVLSRTAPAHVPFLVWTGIDYFALLALETVAVLRTPRTAQGDGGPTSA